MSLPLVMSGHARTYRPPRSLRASLGSEVTAWDLFRLESDESAGTWAGATLTSLVAAIDAETAGALGCSECLDTGFYGVPDSENPDLLRALVRRDGSEPYQLLLADGSWEPWDLSSPLEVLDSDTAADLAAAITADAGGLLRLYGQPRAFLPPAPSIESTTLAVLSAGTGGATQNSSTDSWTTFAVVPAEDPGAVLDLVRFRSQEAERWDEAGWTPDMNLRLAQDTPLVELSDGQLEDVLAQMQPSLTADAPLTVSPDPRAEKLRRYWSSGKGAAKIRWLTPGDWKRCYRHLAKYMGPRAKGYCQNLHKRNTGVWTGSRFNVGGNGRGGLFSSAAPESLLHAALQSGRVSGDHERTGAMPTTLLTDGIYTELDDSPDVLLQNIAASAIPVNPPDEWFENPDLTKPTTLTITDEGRVFGHLAPWGVTHIGMAGSVPAPKSRDGRYAFFRTGQIVTASGKNVRVGQLTLAGGHASRTASAEEAVKHYDDTQSGVADVAVGEDQYGIWAAGALRPGVSPEQIRVMRACPPSGDWRWINGALELVAACHVNVQGFPIAEAMVAGGAIVALVAAGARQMAELRLAERAENSLLERVEHIEQLLADIGTIQAGLVATVTVEDPAPADVAEAPAEVAASADAASDAAPDAAQKISATRDRLAREKLRARVGAAATTTTASAAVTVKGTDSFPIKDVGDLKNAIQAYGRAGDKPAARSHIISMANQLHRPDLIPSSWKASK